MKFGTRFAVFMLAGALSATGFQQLTVEPAQAQAQYVVPAAAGAGAIWITIVYINGMAHNRWRKADGTFYDEPIVRPSPSRSPIYNQPDYQARPRKPRVSPGQMDLFDNSTITTFEECQKAGGVRWKADSALGQRDRKNLGRCYTSDPDAGASQRGV